MASARDCASPNPLLLEHAEQQSHREGNVLPPWCPRGDYTWEMMGSQIHFITIEAEKKILAIAIMPLDNLTGYESR